MMMSSRNLCSRAIRTSCKDATFTMKLSATCQAVPGRCGESRRTNTLTMTVCFFELKLFTVFASKLPIQPVYVHLSTYMNSPNYLYRGIFLLLVTSLDTCTNMICRLGIVIDKNERRQVNECGIQGWHQNQRRQDWDALYTYVVQ